MVLKYYIVVHQILICYKFDEDNDMENIIFVEVKQNNKPLTQEQKIWREALKAFYDYNIETPEGVRHSDIKQSLRCTCIAETPKGVKYHPSLKAVYERSGAKGKWIKTGYKCPKCKRFYDLNGKNPNIIV